MRHPFAAAVALVLGVLGAGGVSAADSPAQTQPAPPEVDLPEDWADLAELPAPSVSPEPAAVGSVLSPAAEEALLLQRFQQALAAANGATTPDRRITAYREVVELFDRIRIRKPEFSFTPGLDVLAAAYVDALNAQRRSLRGEAHERNLGEARAVVLRLGDAKARADKLLEIAEVERGSDSPELLLVALNGLVAEVVGLDPAARDRALLRAVEIAAASGPSPRAASLYWLADIESHALRNRALSQLAVSAIAADPLLATLAANERVGGDRRARLLDLSNYMTNERRFEAATWLAAAAEDDPRGERDEALALVVEDMLDADTAPSDILALHGITRSPLRDRLLLQVVDHSLRTGHLYEARRSAGRITAQRAATIAWAGIGSWLTRQGYRDQARDAGRRALAQYSAAPGKAGPARDAAVAALIDLQVSLGDRMQARGLVAQLGKDAVPGARLTLLRSALDARAWKEADTELSQFSASASRDDALAAYAAALSANSQIPEALSMAERIGRALPRVQALASVIKALASANVDVEQQRQLFRNLEQAAGQVALGSGRDAAQAFVAQAAAAIGDFDRARRSLRLSASSEEFGNALRYTLQRLTLAGQADAALREVAQVWQVNERLRGRVTVATTLARQGEVERAVELVREIDDDRTRVEAFGAIARGAARRSDRLDLLLRAGSAGPSASTILRQDARSADAPAPYSTTRARSLYTLASNDLGQRLPAIPPLGQLTASGVASGIPSIEPGRLHVLPLHYSDFNEKFLASLSYFFNDYGGRLFYFDAQKTPFPVFISLDNGVFDLPSIAHHLERIGMSQYLVREGRRYTLRIPLLVGVNATLVVSGADVQELRMNRNSGAYVVNAGHLHVHDTRVSGWDETLNAPAELEYAASGKFRPFIVGWSGSITDISGSTLTHLGFSGGKAYGLTYSSGPQILVASQAVGLKRPSGRVVDNSFQHMLYGFYSYEADDVAIVGNEYRDNIVYGVDPHDRSRRLVIAYNTAYGTAVKHGIIVSREVDDSWIAGNLSFDNKGSGIMLDRNSKGNLVYANTAFANLQDGVTLFESPCNIVAANDLFSNSRDGIKSRNSWDVGVFGNQLSANGGLAINSYVATLKSEHAGHERDFELDPYTQFSDIALVQNTLTRNSAGGIGLQGVASVTWKGNSLIGQNKPVKGIEKAMLPELYGRSDRGVVVRLGCQLPEVVQACGFKRQGMLPAQVTYEPLAVCAPPASAAARARSAQGSAVNPLSRASAQ